MSALNVCMKMDRCIIMQDAAVYAEDGEILRFQRKGETTANGMFVAATGSAGAASSFAGFVEKFDDVDQLAGAEEGFVRFFDLAISGGLLPDMGVCLAVAGWSPSLDRARCVHFASDIPGVPSAFVGDIGSIMHPILKGDLAARWESFHGIDDINIVRFDPMVDGLHLMELQRRQPGGARSREGQFLVGGHVTLTEVTRAGIDQRIVRTWDEDCEGRRIVPGPMPDLAAKVASIAPAIAMRDGMNRAERRRAEKMMKRGRVA